jgi:hypothetical protein
VISSTQGRQLQYHLDGCQWYKARQIKHFPVEERQPMRESGASEAARISSSAEQRGRQKKGRSRRNNQRSAERR